jgi:predicted nucleic acid-binding protein
MSRIFWDTNLFIYLLEDYSEQSTTVTAIRHRMLERGDQLFTSTLTLGEVLVKPIERANEKLKRLYKDILTQSAILLSFDENAAIRYAAIRNDRSIKAPDAIQLACAAQAGIDLFITNDDHLKGKAIPGVQFIAGLNSAPI